MLEEIKKLAEEIRKNPNDVDGVVDFNTSKIIEMCDEKLKEKAKRDYENCASEMVSREIEKEISNTFLGGE